MKKALRDLAGAAFDRASAANVGNIVSLLEPQVGGALLDLGCDDGLLTRRFAERVRASDVRGVEVVVERAAEARARGVEVTVADLNGQLPFETDTFDVVVSNQVIEHLAETDTFLIEIARILRPAGYAVVSTENLAGWHNVMSLVCGWQPFSLTNVTATRLGLGNPLALHRDDPWERGSTWQHLRVFAYRGLRELFESHGFVVEAVLGAGYYPLPRRLAALDPRHASFLSVKARLPPRTP